MKITPKTVIITIISILAYSAFMIIAVTIIGNLDKLAEETSKQIKAATAQSAVIKEAKLKLDLKTVEAGFTFSEHDIYEPKKIYLLKDKLRDYKNSIKKSETETTESFKKKEKKLLQEFMEQFSNSILLPLRTARIPELNSGLFYDADTSRFISQICADNVPNETFAWCFFYGEKHINEYFANNIFNAKFNVVSTIKRAGVLEVEKKILQEAQEYFEKELNKKYKTREEIGNLFKDERPFFMVYGRLLDNSGRDYFIHNKPTTKEPVELYSTTNLYRFELKGIYLVDKTYTVLSHFKAIENNI